MYKQSSATAQRSALAASLLLLFALPLLAQSGPTTVRRNVHHDVSRPLSEMIRHAPPPSLTRRPVEPMRRIPLPPGLEQLQEDPVLQTATVAPPTPPVLQSFEGLGNGQYGFSVTGAPPDTNGTVGATQYVQWVNTSFAIFSKSNGALIAGTTATQVCFQQSTAVGGLLPADLDGTTAPPTGSPNYLLYFGTNNLNLFKFHVDFSTPANSTFTGPTVINVAAFSPLCSGGTCVPQPGTTNTLDSLADRLMYRLAYRNFGDHESLVVTHSVTGSGTAAPRWYELRSPGTQTFTVAQASSYAPDATYRWMGSAAMAK